MSVILASGLQSAMPLLLIVGLLLLPASLVAQDAGNPDVLYADREQLSSAERAAAIWEAELAADRRAFVAAWKLARACYWLGGHVPKDGRRAQYERGMRAARQAVELEPMKPEGHFWLAANMGALAESFGLRNGLRYRGAIRSELETVLRIDPAFLNGSADRALGRWYFKVPRLFGGSREKAVEHLRASLVYKPDSTATLFFLAETLLDMKRTKEAHAALMAVLDAPLDPDWAPEDREFKAQATTLLATSNP